MKKIAFVLPTTLSNGGGVKIVFEYANTINNNNIAKCDVIYPVIPCNYKLHKFTSIKGLCKYFGTLLFNIFGYNLKKFLKKYPNVNIYRVISLKQKNIYDKYDEVITTAWDTTYYTNNINKKRKYFVQSYESWAGPLDYVKGTYENKDLEIITITQYLSDLLYKLHERKSDIIYNPVMMDIIDEKNVLKTKISDYKYGVIYRNSPWKSFDTVIEFLKENKQYRHKFICIGQNVPSKYNKYFSEIMDGSSNENMKNFYDKIDVLILPSTNEGFGLPIIESMSRGTIVISKKIGFLYDFGVENKNYIKVGIDDIKDIKFNGVFTKIASADIKRAIDLVENMSEIEIYNMKVLAKYTIEKYSDNAHVVSNAKKITG